MSDEQQPYEGSEPQQANPSPSPHQSPIQSPHQAAAVPPYQTDTPPYQAEMPPYQATVPPYQTEVPPQQTAFPPYQATVPPYQPTPPYQSMEPPYQTKPARRWPWVLLGILIGLVIGFGGCVSCTLGALAFRSMNTYDSRYDYDYSDPYSYDSTDPYDGYLDNGIDEFDFDSMLDSYNTYTYDEIKTFYNVSEGTYQGNQGGAGIYRVGTSEDVKPGTYYLAGNQDYICDFAIYRPTGTDADTYEVVTQNVYLGNYFVELGEGDVFVFVPDGNETFRPASSEPLTVTPPYQSGMYRVGIDIPAGTYRVTVNAEADVGDSREAAAFIFSSLSADDSTTEEAFYVMAGGHHDITVKDGQYLELFGAQAEPTEER